MTRKIIRTQNSDGTWSETTEQKTGGFVRGFGWVLGFGFVVAIALRYPWMWAIYGLLLIIAIVGGVEKRRQRG